jgi:uncharacterized membrane protein YraQ (UPF0718 family)
MSKGLRIRIIVLQFVAVLGLAIGSFGAFYANNFTNTQIHNMLAPEQIVFPQTAAQGLPADLQAYAGKQVLTGDQAHAYAEKFIGLHLKEIGNNQPYSYWSAQARTAPDAATKAKDQAIADTLFKGETLRAILNEAWTFSVFGQIAYYAGIGLALAGAVVLLALSFEVAEYVRKRDTYAVAVASAPRQPAGVR